MSCAIVRSIVGPRADPAGNILEGMVPRRNRHRWAPAAALLAWFGAVGATETVGPHTIEATPVSAVLVSGGGVSFKWLNIVNSPLTLDEALTGFSVIDDGY